MTGRPHATFYLHDGPSAESLTTCSSIRSFYTCRGIIATASVPSLTYSDDAESFEAVALARNGSVSTTADLHRPHSPLSLLSSYFFDTTGSVPSLTFSDDTGSIEPVALARVSSPATTVDSNRPDSAANSVGQTYSVGNVTPAELHASPTVTSGLTVSSLVADTISGSQYSFDEVALAGIDSGATTTIDIARLDKSESGEAKVPDAPLKGDVDEDKVRPRIHTNIARYNDGHKEPRGPDRSPWSPMSGEPDLILDTKYRQLAPWQIYGGAMKDEFGDLGGPFRGEPEESFFGLIDARYSLRDPLALRPKSHVRQPLHQRAPWGCPIPTVLPPPAPNQTQPSIFNGGLSQSMHIPDLPKRRWTNILLFGKIPDRYHRRKVKIVKAMENGVDRCGDGWWNFVEAGYKVRDAMCGSKESNKAKMGPTDKRNKEGEMEKDDKPEKGGEGAERKHGGINVSKKGKKWYQAWNVRKQGKGEVK